jgi:glycyl-tRNA synthetase beta chain
VLADLGPIPHDAATLVFEIGTEEIPSTALYKATEQLAQLAEAALTDARLEHGPVRTMSTPRRLILEVHRLAPMSTPLVQKFRGPAVKIAFDAQGNPTKAAEGFARGKGVDVRELTRAMEGDTEYVYANVERIARKTETLLPQILSDLITSITWPKSQRWGAGEARFSRPVRWLLALWGERIIPATFAGLTAGRLTWGHRLLANEPAEVASADDLASVHTKQWIVPSAEMRAAKIQASVKAIEEETGLTAYMPKDVFAEVVNLVEFPTTLVGTFDEEFLEVPHEIITDAMLKHQRYFPLYNASGELANKFIVVSNGSPAYNSAIVAGHERVVRPRLADAAFFYHEDLKRPLREYVDDLKQVVFHEKLGTVYAKAQRISHLAGDVATFAQGTEQQIADSQRAGLLCKADLVTHAVVEFTSLQGTMGSYYASASGEDAEVALAIGEHYKPRYATDDLPANFAGQAVAIADKADTICGIFAAGQAPTGSSDPFAVRRASIGVINILLAGLPASLEAIINAAMGGFSDIVDDKQAVTQAVRQFFATRLEVIARERGYRADTIAAIQAVGVIEPVDLMARCAALEAARAEQPELFDDLATAFERANNLRDASLGAEVDASLFSEPETALNEAITTARTAVKGALEAKDYAAALAALAKLRTPIDRFFEDVLIMAEDKRLRDNRLRLLNAFVAPFEHVAAFEQLAGK